MLASITGKQVLRKQFRAAERITFDMSGKVSGMYFVKLDFEGKQVLVWKENKLPCDKQNYHIIKIFSRPIW